MTNNAIIWIILSFLFMSCINDTRSKEYVEAIQWEIQLPADYIKKTEKEIKALMKATSDSLSSKGYDNDTNTKMPLFYYNRGDFNTIDASFLEYDVSKEPLSYDELHKRFKKTYYEVIVSRLEQDMLIDSLSFQQNVGDLVFDVFQLEITIQGMTWITRRYDRLFDDQILQIKLSYIDDNERRKLLKALETSSFGE